MYRCDLYFLIIRSSVEIEIQDVSAIDSAVDLYADKSTTNKDMQIDESSVASEMNWPVGEARRIGILVNSSCSFGWLGDHVQAQLLGLVRGVEFKREMAMAFPKPKITSIVRRAQDVSDEINAESLVPSPPKEHRLKHKFTKTYHTFPTKENYGTSSPFNEPLSRNDSRRARKVSYAAPPPRLTVWQKVKAFCTRGCGSLADVN
ncbi:hypothetical protein BDR26DRAFT_892588 [Obelidium mucronatum]|nr:hypothetical protein BDR26DRAFT_892588 [Obelidium mucronatum]